MPEYTNPTGQDFASAEQLVVDVIANNCPTVQTKTGSAVRELIARPFAYLYSWCVSNIDRLRRDASVAKLKTSSSTDNELADIIAGNYFIYRKPGSYAKGVITATVATPNIQVQRGSEFTASGVALYVEKRVIATPGTYMDTENVLYTPAVPYNGSYLVSIPVVARNSGAYELPAGTAAAPSSFVSSNILSCELTSALTGGADAETDASMMARAELVSASAGVGTKHGLMRKLADAPVPVIDIGVVAGEDSMADRSRHNSVNINPCGFVDCYVRTQLQPATGLVACTANDGVVHIEGLVNEAGAYGVVSVIQDGTAINDYSVTFGTTEAHGKASYSRLGIHQTIDIASDSLEDGAVSVTLSYMPGIRDLQRYMERSDNCFVGQDVAIKAAVPVDIRVDCTVRSRSDADIGQDELDSIRALVAQRISTYPVGAEVLNFSDVQEYCKNNMPDIELRIPCTLFCSVMLADGSVDSYYSNTGLVDISNMPGKAFWSSKLCFFSCIKDNVRLSVI